MQASQLSDAISETLTKHRIIKWSATSRRNSQESFAVNSLNLNRSLSFLLPKKHRNTSTMIHLIESMTIILRFRLRPCHINPNINSKRNRISKHRQLQWFFRQAQDQSSHLEDNSSSSNSSRKNYFSNKNKSKTLIILLVRLLLTLKISIISKSKTIVKVCCKRRVVPLQHLLDLQQLQLISHISTVWTKQRTS